jgi:hypothetical protein
MFMMWLTGHPINSPVMIELQKLAQIQTGMEIMVAQGQYSGMSLVDMWRDGMLPRMYFKNPQTHTTLYVDKLINPLGLSELIWWASMMSMLGIENAEEFKQTILAQREKIIKEKFSFNQSPTAVSASDVQLLSDIKNELVEIKNILAKK